MENRCPHGSCDRSGLDLINEISDSMAHTGDIMYEFQSILKKLRNGMGEEQKVAVAMSEAIKCSLCSIVEMAAIGDIDGLKAVKGSVMYEAGCSTVVVSH